MNIVLSCQRFEVKINDECSTKFLYTCVHFFSWIFLLQWVEFFYIQQKTKFLTIRLVIEWLTHCMANPHCLKTKENSIQTIGFQLKHSLIFDPLVLSIFWRCISAICQRSAKPKSWIHQHSTSVEIHDKQMNLCHFGCLENADCM